MDASCKVQGSIHVFHLKVRSICPGFWVHINIRSFFYGVGGIRTHEPRKDYLISSQARYDHFDTTPSVPQAASRCACLDIIGYQTAGMQEQNSSYADSEIWYNQLYTQRPVRGMGMQYGGAGTADQNQGYNKG